MNITLTYDSQRTDLVHDRERGFTGRIVRNGKGNWYVAPYNIEKFQKMPDSKYAYYLDRIARIVERERPDLVGHPTPVAA